MKIATIERITQVSTHPDADRLDLVHVLGYQCITPKDKYNINDLVVYIQPDSVLPLDEEWSQEYLKYARIRVKAIKIRGEWSEGIILSLDLIRAVVQNNGCGVQVTEKEGEDLAELLHIHHYEPVIPQGLNAIGHLPFGIPETNEERWENLINDLPFNQLVDVTLKIDGQSCTIYYNYRTKQFGVCGRNFEYDLTKTNNFTQIVKKQNLADRLRVYCEKKQISLALRGELFGSGIQNKSTNSHSKQPLQLAIFSVFLLDQKRHARKNDGELYFHNLCRELEIQHVPVLEENVELTQELINKYSKELKLINNNPFEGAVVQYERGSFKIINKHYDSKN
ncbi:unnamed protein product [Didymodactylos carnosus]|uniref:RNA ligase domain-containing protein n=1 Tax=Didymodactylos carnosus TaxID=1234261 RepID=A0A813Z2I1_9BILA|nr:unnamed protein product [Didymodactylos carnosus]CAF1469366.1 unnamed protein product [Didymodactylos carnosus]CAF3676133.1 unnamed protein product [Didymodactylos carnosus]CAF4261477.1 unnamed protein product [Didymodactylos carnosus]